jgi:hypothetical protein
MQRAEAQARLCSPAAARGTSAAAVQPALAEQSRKVEASGTRGNAPGRAQIFRRYQTARPGQVRALVDGLNGSPRRELATLHARCSTTCN